MSNRKGVVPPPHHHNYSYGDQERAFWKGIDRSGHVDSEIEIQDDAVYLVGMDVSQEVPALLKTTSNKSNLSVKNGVWEHFLRLIDSLNGLTESRGKTTLCKNI